MMNVVMYLVTGVSADRIAIRLFNEGYSMKPALDNGKFVHKLVGSYLLTFDSEAPQKLRDKKPDELHDIFSRMMVELGIPYYGGQLKSDGLTTYLGGHMPPVAKKPIVKKPNGEVNVIPFPKPSPGKSE